MKYWGRCTRTSLFALVVLLVLAITLLPGHVKKATSVYFSLALHQRKPSPEPSPAGPDFRVAQSATGIEGRAVWPETAEPGPGNRNSGPPAAGSYQRQPLYFTHDDWPQFPRNPFNASIPRTPFNPSYSIQWDFDTSTFLQRPDVKGKPPKLITWMERVRYLPSILEPVRMRTCPEMPCRITTNRDYRRESAALVWCVQHMNDSKPPQRTNPDQVFVFHNQERQSKNWIYKPSFRKPAWRSAFNWTMSFRLDADILDPYGYLSKRPSPPSKNYSAILAQKTKMAAWLVSRCESEGKREKYVAMLKKYLPVDVYGRCGPHSCARSKDDECFENISKKYKFYLAFENAICEDYFSEKFFRYLGADVVLVARGGPGYENHSPPGTFINTADFKTIKDLANNLHFLDKNPEEYIKILRAKDLYQPMYEEYPHRDSMGRITFMHYQYEAVPFCELCRRLWDLDRYRKTIPDIMDWFNRGNCVAPQDLH